MYKLCEHKGRDTRCDKSLRHVAATGCCNKSPRVTCENHCRCNLSHKFKLDWICGTYRSDKLSASNLSHQQCRRGDLSLQFVASCVSALKADLAYGMYAVLSIRPGTRRSSGGYSVESRRVYFTAFKYRVEKKKENNNRYMILHYWLHLHGVFRWNSKKYVSISVVCLYHSFADWQFFSIRWNASRFVCLFCAFLHVLKFTQ